jgi:hypothetical protein
VEIGAHQELVGVKGLDYGMWRQQIAERRTIATPTVGEEEPVELQECCGV